MVECLVLVLDRIDYQISSDADLDKIIHDSLVACGAGVHAISFHCHLRHFIGAEKSICVRVSLTIYTNHSSA